MASYQDLHMTSNTSPGKFIVNQPFDAVTPGFVLASLERGLPTRTDSTSAVGEIVRFAWPHFVLIRNGFL